VELNISSMDSDGIVKMLDENKPTILKLVRKAYPTTKFVPLNPRNRRERARMIAVQLRMQLALERSLTRSMTAAITRQATIAATAYLEETNDTAAARAAIVAVNETLSDIRKTLETFYRSVYEKVGRPAINSIQGKQESVRIETKDVDSEFIRRQKEYIAENGLKKAEAISETTKRKINRIIVNGISEGKGPRDVARGIVSSISGTGRQTARTRSIMIARTETHSAANSAMNDAIGSTGFSPIKEWGTVEDGRVRPDHEAADGQRVGFNESFSIGADTLKFPGDPRGPASQIVQCRCVLLYRTE